MQLNSEAPGTSGCWILQEPTSVLAKDGIFAANQLNKNISVQTGEEFSRQFLQDRLNPTKIAVVPDLSKNHVGLNKNQNIPLGYEEITTMLGLKRMDSEYGYDITEFASAKGSTTEDQNGAYNNQARRCYTESSDPDRRPRTTTGEMNCDPAALRPSPPPVNELESSRVSQSHSSGVLDGSQSVKIKFLCSFGGQILPRPSDGKFRYVGGDTRIISIRKNLKWEELVKKTSGICTQPHTIKYQLPGEDLDALISVSSDEDLQNMIEEYEGLEKLGGSQRLRIFLIPLSESDNACPLDASSIQQNTSGYQYVAAVNGIAEPSQTTSGQLLETDTNQIRIDLETKDKLSDSNPIQYGNESQNPVWSNVQSPPSSAVPVQQGDTRSGPTQMYKENIFLGNIENSNLFSAAQVPPESSSSDASGLCHPPHEVLTSANCHVPNNIDDFRQPIRPGGEKFHNDISSKEYVLPSGFDPDDSNVDKYFFEKPMPRERIFHSAMPLSNNEDAKGLLGGSNDSIIFQPGIPHAFSDSLLQEHGGKSACCSQEGLSPSSPLNFLLPQLPSQPVLDALQEKQHELTEYIPLADPVQIKLLNVEPTASDRRLDVLSCSSSSELSRKNEISQEETGYFDGGKDVINWTIKNIKEASGQSCETLNMLDRKEHLLCVDGKLCKSKPTPSATSCMNQSPAIICDPISTLSADTSSQECVGMVAASSGIGLKYFEGTWMEPPRNVELDKAPVEFMIDGQRTSNDQNHVLVGVASGGHGSNVPKVTNSNIEGMFLGSKAPADLLCGFVDGLVYHESPVVLAGECQKTQNNMGLQEPIPGSSADLYPSIVCDNTAVCAPLHCPPGGPNPTKGCGFRGEVSLIDDDFVNYPDQSVVNPAILQCIDNGKTTENVQLNNFNEQHQQDSPVTIPNNVDATKGEIQFPGVMEFESILPDSDSENSRAEDGCKNESITDAMIAEMEANIIGLQIIKNADLEELRELGSGTFGTVYHGKWRGTDVAIKRIKNSCFSGRSSEQDRLTKDFWREAQILSNLHHPNVVAFYGVVPDGKGGTLATVAEFMANGSLRNVLLKKDRSLDRRRKLIIAMDAAFGMEYLHSKNIVHFDLKCDNLLVNLRDPQKPICKVGDFGLSRIKRNTLVSGGVRGTLPWMAPELLTGNSTRVSEKVDVFSFGITLWEILTGDEPYANMHCGAIIGGILKDTLRPSIPEHCDPEWRKLMEQCWATDPEARPSFTEVANRLRSMSESLLAKGQSNSKQTKPGMPS
ncbi:Non-specific serine/threonine protein kinase [Bertholletia excelsa]